MVCRQVLACVMLLQVSATLAQLTPEQEILCDEHIYLGQPDSLSVLIRQGYVVQYDSALRIPVWAAYHLVPEYLNTPKREKKYKYFRKDPDVKDPVVTGDYTGSGFARGHMVPYFAMGGDRDANGIRSNHLEESEDPYDDQTIFQANYMTNIAPQDQDALNGSGGPWYALETQIRNTLIDTLRELHLVVGSIVSDREHAPRLVSRSGNTRIAIPDQFYQVLIWQDSTSGLHTTGAFLFPHVRQRNQLPYELLSDYLVPVDSIEVLTGLDLFPLLPDDEESTVEAEDHKDFWNSLLK